MTDIISGINPTRMELIKLNKKIKLADKGYKLLKEKRDALIMKFLEIIKQGSNLRTDVEKHFKQAYNDLVKSKAIMGALEVKSASMAVREIANAKFQTKNIIGIKVPEIALEEDERNLGNRGYSPITTSASLDEASSKFDTALNLVVQMAEVEKTIQMLATEVEKTKRRVNALEYIVIPRMRNTAKFIRMRLDEMEREDFSRLKKIKSKLAKKKEASLNDNN
jgi:V/A-type H+-transporting ATPase subunit D|tara:strand:+ start:671 stop:1336 length:666 start_codon:yes stop_codon:yes gene_type:complete